MEPKLHRRVQRYGWDLAVQDYDRYFVPLLRHCSERCLEMAGLKPGERVLDVATGTGVAAFLARSASVRRGRWWRRTYRRRWWTPCGRRRSGRASGT